MKKRGISPLIATILLIGIVVIVTLIVLNWTSKVAEQQIGDTDLRISSLTYDLSFGAECLTDETGTKILIENKVGKTIEYMVFGLDGEIIQEQTNLEPYEIDSIPFPGLSFVSEVKITPQVKINEELVNLLVNSKTEECEIYLEIVPLFIEGCGDQSALNYNPDIDIPVNNCVYPPGGEDGEGSPEDWEGVIFYFGNVDHENEFLEVYVGNFLSDSLFLINGYVDGILPPTTLDTSYSDYFWNLAYSTEINESVFVSLVTLPSSGISYGEQGFLFNLNYEFFDSEVFCLSDFVANNESNEVVLGNCLDVNSTEFLIPGCIDEIACNFDENATLDNGSCIYPDENYDCEGGCLVEIDCDGVCNGNAILDNCEICSGGSTNHEFNSDKDCEGVCFGPAVEDCMGVCDGGAQLDSCLVCYGGTSPVNSPNLDVGLLTSGECSGNYFPMCFETSAALGVGHDYGYCPAYDIRYRGPDPTFPYGLAEHFGAYCSGPVGNYGGGAPSPTDCCESQGFEFDYVSPPLNLGLLPEQALYALICEY